MRERHDARWLAILREAARERRLAWGKGGWIMLGVLTMGGLQTWVLIPDQLWVCAVLSFPIAILAVVLIVKGRRAKREPEHPASEQKESRSQ